MPLPMPLLAPVTITDRPAMEASMCPPASVDFVIFRNPAPGAVRFKASDPQRRYEPNHSRRTWTMIRTLSLPAPDAASNPVLAPGDVLGDCEILALLGQGGTGEIYLAPDRRLLTGDTLSTSCGGSIHGIRTRG